MSTAATRGSRHHRSVQAQSIRQEHDPGTSRRRMSWDDLDPVEQSLLVVAAKESTLDQACASWAGQPRRPAAVELTKSVALSMYRAGLIGFYRIDDGYPDMSDTDLTRVFQGRTYWDAGHVNSRRVGVFLTAAGEDTVLGP